MQILNSWNDMIGQRVDPCGAGAVTFYVTPNG